jgi:cytochrome c oxidase assembly protein subunit 15
VLLAALVWTALDAWAGAPRQTIPGPWVKASFGLTGLFYFQILLGALVAGNDAGLVYNDWPMMNGALFPADYAGSGLWSTLAHSQAAVQFNHRIFAYLLTVLTAVFVVQAVRSPYLLPEVKRLALALGVVVGLQVLLGIVTLTSRVPISLGMAHQVTAAILLAVSVAFVWRVRRP